MTHAPADEPPSRFVLLGYFPKLVLPRRDELWMAENVEEICSASACISGTPEGWIDLWRHNACFFYDDEATAREIAAIDPRPFEIFAYRALDRRFDEAGVHPVAFPPLSVAPLAHAYEMIGYDAVECTSGLETGAAIECSPLSCNRMSKEIEVNRFCLIDELDRAIEVARRFGSGVDGVEPGPYYLFDVWRRRKGAAPT